MAVIIDQSGSIPVPVTPKNDESILRAVKGNISLDDVKDSKGRYAVSAVDFSHLSRVNLSTPQIASPSVVTFNGMPKQVTQVIHNNAGNGQLNVNPTGGVTSNLPHANQSSQTLQVIANVGGNGQLNVSPTGGVTNTLPYTNHDVSVRTTLASTAGGDGSYLNTSQVFNRHLNQANQAGLADDPAGNWLRWKGSQQTALLTNPGANHILDPQFTNVADFWQGNGTASGGVLNQGSLAANAVSDNNNFDGRGNVVGAPCYPGDIVVLELTSTQAPTGTATTGIIARFKNSSGGTISFGNWAYVPSVGTGTATSVSTAPAGCNSVQFLIESAGNASGGNSALVTNPQCRINHETVADVSAKKAYMDFTDNTSGGHVGKSLANVPDDSGSNRFAVLAIDSNRRPLIDFTQSSHVGKTQSNIADDANAKMLRFGTLAGRPAAGTSGRIYHASDAGTNGITYRDTGSAWVEVGVGHLADINGTLDNTNDGSSRFAVAAVDPNKKALIDFSQPAHVNANLQYFGGIQSGTCYDGQAITFNPAYSSIPLVIFPSGGMTYSSAVGSATSQSLAFTASSLTASGFTASLKLVTGGTLTARSDTFSAVITGSEYQATLTNAPAYNNTYTVNWVLSLNSSSDGTVYIRETNSSGTILFSKTYLSGQNGAKSTNVVWSGATGTSVIDISLVINSGSGTIGPTTVTFTSGTAPSTNSAVPSTAPIQWIAFPQT